MPSFLYHLTYSESGGLEAVRTHMTWPSCRLQRSVALLRVVCTSSGALNMVYLSKVIKSLQLGFQPGQGRVVRSVVSAPQSHSIGDSDTRLVGSIGHSCRFVTQTANGRAPGPRFTAPQRACSLVRFGTQIEVTLRRCAAAPLRVRTTSVSGVVGGVRHQMAGFTFETCQILLSYDRNIFVGIKEPFLFVSAVHRRSRPRDRQP